MTPCCLCRDQVAACKSSLSHDIGSLSRVLEQHKLQCRAERSDATCNMQTMQQQFSEIAQAVKGLESMCMQALHQSQHCASAAMPSHPVPLPSPNAPVQTHRGHIGHELGYKTGSFQAAEVPIQPQPSGVQVHLTALAAYSAPKINSVLRDHTPCSNLRTLSCAPGVQIKTNGRTDQDRTT